ncbi:helicase SRCAP isoform X3 [Rana temporaria]|uniref:helicase SRCAP isoform X3 n=1 Tax=Rana temporaria TaxID=8407 RepID=UPI001AAD886C|nr:helicase SRCAP isoform X3 [Rana temporaria]
MHPSPARRPPQASDAVTAGIPPMSPGSSGELSPFDLLGDIGDLGPGSPTDDGLDGNQNDSSSGQKNDGHTEIAEQAKHEAEIENRIAELRKEGFWTQRRLSKFPEPTRPKILWDYLCEEMQWLAADFAQERRWKRGVARKVVRMVVRHHEELKQKEERARREEQAKLRRIATSIAKEVRQFWSNVEKVVQFKQQSRLEAKRKKALDLQLDFIVGQTEKYSDLLSQSLNETAPVSKTSSSCFGSSQGGSLRTSPTPSVCQKDGEFLPHEDEAEEEDDEETIEIEERQDGNDAESHRLELELLKRESELPLDELLQSLPPQILQEEADIEDAESEQDDDSEEEDNIVAEEDDEEFTANEEEAEDEEETIAAEEALEGQQDHTEELSQLAQEGEMSIEDLLKNYSLVRTDEEEMVEQSESSLISEQEASESSECDSSDCESEGVEFLVKQQDEDVGTDQSQQEAPEPKKEITDIAATAESLQPKGYTLATTQVKTPVPFLLRGDLREYQHIGLEWLVTMYEKKLNGILADEMGLGKTIQTISLLAHLACERGNWGPHLIIVPTSVILNWEMELKRWCPSFKILTYYGNQKERKLKRQGWTKANAFHVCITSYKLVLQDHQAFRRKNWRYLILDEAQNIKNFKSQRWQSLLNFNSQRRLLLTGTPLQNSLMELWSLMHFLMPHVFQSHREFKEWFSNPLTGMIEGSQEYNEGLVRRLHKVLRPFLLRRIKIDVEKQMPKKYEHVIYCRLSKRQRFLYDDFMAQAATRESLASGHFMSVINILMQLRKVCNHPNLFDPRPIHSPFITSAICYSVPSPVLHALQRHPLEYVDTSWFDLVNLEGHVSRYESDIFLSRHKPSRQLIQEIADSPEPPPRPRPLKMKVNRMLQPVVKPESRSVVVNSSQPVQKLQDTPPAPSPPPPPSTLLPPPPPNPPPPAIGALGQAQPAPQVLPLVQSTPVAMPTPVAMSTPAYSELGKSTLLQNSQTVYSGPQRFILSPDMQARLPSGEVVSLSQLASLSGRPIHSPSTTKPLTLQLQGAKFTLSGAQVRPVGVSQPRPMQGNVLHLVSSGGQHHLLSQPAQLALIQALAQQAGSQAPAAAAAQLVQNSGSAQIGVQALSVQGLQHPLMNNTNIPPPSGPAPGQVVNTPGVMKIVVRQAPREVQSSSQRPPLAPQVRPVLRVLPSGAHGEQLTPRDGLVDRAAPATSNITLASSPLLMVSSPMMTSRLPSPCTIVPSTEDSPTPPLSGVALRLVTTGPSPAVQLANHHSSTPGHSAIPAMTNCSPFTTLTSAPSNGATTQPMVGSDSSPIFLKSSQNSDSTLLNSHPVQNGNGLQNQLSDSLPPAVPMTSVPSTVNSPSPPAAIIPKVSPPTYNLSLVPALIANSASSSAARFLTSPLSLLALSPLAATNTGPAPVIYTPPNAAAFPALAAPSLSAPLPSVSVSAPLPLLAAPSLSAPLPSVSASLPLLAAPSLSAPLPSVSASLPLLSAPLPSASVSASLPFLPAQSLSAPLPSASVSASLPFLSAPSLSAPLTSASLPFLAAQSLSGSLPSASVSASLPFLSAPSLSAPLTSASLPFLSAPLTSVSASLPFLSAPIPSASVSASLPFLSAPLTSASVSASLPLLVAQSLSAPLPSASVSASLPFLSAPLPSASLPLQVSQSFSAPLPSASVSASLPLQVSQSFSAPLPSASVSAPLPLLAGPVSGQLASFAAPLPISSANQNPLTVPHVSVEMPSTVPVLSSPVSVPLPAPTSGPLPALSTPPPGTLLAATASMLEASGNQPLLLSPDSAPMPLLNTSLDTLPPPVLNTSLKLPPMASAPVPILPAPVSNAFPLLAAASGKVPLLCITSASTNVPLLPASTATRVSSVLPSTCVPNQPGAMRAQGAVASIMYTTSISSFTNSPSPLLSTSTSFPSLLPKPSAPLLAVQVKAPTLLPSGLVEAPTSMASVPPQVPASCTLPAETPGPLLMSAALKPAVVSTLVASVPTPGSAQPVMPMVQIKAPAPLPSLPASTVIPSMPASAPASLPSLPASTPIPLPLLAASTPTPVSSLPASSPDPSSLLLVSAPAQAPGLSSPILASSVDHAPVSLLPSSGTNPLVISVSAPLTLTASSPSLVLSAPSHVPLLPSQPIDAQPPGITVPKPYSSPSPFTSHSNLSTSPLTNTPDTTSTLPTLVNSQESKNFPESSLSLSIAGPPPVSVTFSTASESEITLEGDESRITHSAAINTCVRPRRLLPPPPRSPFYLEPLEERRKKQKMERLERIFHLNERRCSLSPVYGTEVLSVCTLQTSLSGTCSPQTDALRRCIFTPEQRLEQLRPTIERFIIAMPPVEARQITLHTSHPPPSMLLQESLFRERLSHELTSHTRCLHRIVSNMRTQFPDLRLIQYDCGKLQTMDRLLRDLKYGGHRVLLFTQMTRMLDVLEQFLNYHGHIYLRLDGSTRVEQRQVLMERFNMDKRIFCFILSTRSGGVGVNLTGADTVIFYDSDWNPTMDAQAQDRCHRIGQTRDVHIYRLVSERTVEENILKKAQQKRMLGDMAIEGGNFTTAYFKQHTIKELFEMEDIPCKESETRAVSPVQSTEEGASVRQSNILEQALGRAEDEEDTLAASLVKAEQVADLAEFNENVPLEPEEEEQNRVEQEISALVEQLTPIERYAMYFLEASLEEVSREELKQAEEQVEAARKDLILAKDESGQSIEEKWDEEMRKNRRVRTPTPARTPGERVGVRMSERLRGNKAAEPTDIAESLAIPDVPLSAQEDHCEASTQTLEVPPVPNVDDDRHDAETSCSAAVTSEPTMSPIVPPVPQTEESTTETVKQEAEDEGPAPVEEEETVCAPSTELTPGSPVASGCTPGSPVASGRSPVASGRTPGSPVASGRSPVASGCTPGSPVASGHSPVASGRSPVASGHTPGSPVASGHTPGSPVASGHTPSSPVASGHSPVASGHTPGSPGTSPREEPTPPRTPRRKITADCEILLAGASENSPAAKVLRRLPGRLVTVVQERLPAARRHTKGKGEQASLDNGVLSPNVPEYQSPPRDLLSEDSSETGSPPPKRKRGRPPKISVDMSSPTAVPDLPLGDKSPEPPPPPPPPAVISELSPPCPGQTPASPSFSSKMNLESENSSAEKRKRGRPPKRRESSPATSPMSPAGSPLRVVRSPLVVSPVGALPPSPICASPRSPVIASPPPSASVVGDAGRGRSQAHTTEAKSSDDRRRSDPLPSALCDPTAKSTIPSDSSNIPSVGGEATSSSGADEPVTPSKRRRGRPPRSQMVPKANCSLTSHKLDSSPDRSPSPQMTTRACQRKPLKAETIDSKEPNSSLADTDDSSEDEEIRTPLTRSARTRLETGQTPYVVSKNSAGTSPKTQRGRSPRVTPTSEKSATKRRKPPSESSPSPTSSSPNGSSSGNQKGARRRRHCSPAERVLRSSLTANPASNTRSARSQLQYFPSSNRGRKAKT